MLTVLVIALLVLIALALTRLPWLVRVIVSAWVVVYAWVSVRRLGRHTLRSVGWHADDSWTLQLADGGDAPGRLLSGRVIGPLIVLRLAWSDGDGCALILLPDNTDVDVRRRLRVRLSAFSDSG